jgi:hypothetical protein|tara:strand:+ start:1343 stop:1834 length:492 start_codon:yes stop_codon:yes gene_type:complete
MATATKRKRLIKEIVEKRVDGEGNVTESSNITEFSRNSEPNFIKLYLEDLARLQSMPKGVSSILWALVSRMDYENYITLSAVIRKRTAASCGVSDAVLRNALTKIVAAGIFHREDTNTYLVDPAIFAKGAWSDIVKRRDRYEKLTLTIKYDVHGKREISSFLE